MSSFLLVLQNCSYNWAKTGSSERRFLIKPQRLETSKEAFSTDTLELPGRDPSQKPLKIWAV